MRKTENPLLVVQYKWNLKVENLFLGVDFQPKMKKTENPFWVDQFGRVENSGKPVFSGSFLTENLKNGKPVFSGSI